MAKIYFCKSCKKYTLKKKCSCGKDTVNPEPPKFKIEDKYGKYRRLAKKDK